MLAGYLLSFSLLSVWLDHVERRCYGTQPGIQVCGREVGSLYNFEVRAVVQELALQKMRLPVEPSIDRTNGQIISGQGGCVVDVEQTVANIMSAQKNQMVALVFIHTRPQHNELDLQKATTRLGYFQTTVTGSGQRFHNIEMAAKEINYYLLWPGERFSFNEAVGPRTIERGYQPAPVIMGGEWDIDYGGGVCQTASTLYNTVLSAKLSVIERHPHSQEVSYVKPGQDAAVSYGYLDLKFVNNRSGPVIIRAGLQHNQIWVEIKGGGNTE